MEDEQQKSETQSARLPTFIQHVFKTVDADARDAEFGSRIEGVRVQATCYGVAVNDALPPFDETAIAPGGGSVLPGGGAVTVTLAD